MSPYWPYCSAANHLKSGVFNGQDWDTLSWRRHLETFERQLQAGTSDQAQRLRGPHAELDSICNAGELTDRGRQTTLALGQRLRRLYISQLAFLPSNLSASTSNLISLRATPIPRALESTQQAFIGLYPKQHRETDFQPPSITQRSFSDETLFPNEGSCKRFAELARAFADRTAKLWNDSPELAYINKKIGKYMPAESPIVKVDSHPRLSGVFDTVNATLAHGPDTKLPSEFYDKQFVSNVDRVCTEEWFVGYQESTEYRKLGIGALIGDLVQNMVASTRKSDHFRMSLSGCHDTTIAATLASFGAFDVTRDGWPSYTSSIAIELLRQRDLPSSSFGATKQASTSKTWWSSLFGAANVDSASTRQPLNEMSPTKQRGLDGYFVRLRYNDKPLSLPACRAAQDHFEGDETLCTLAAFKKAADSFTPKDWKAECKMNLGQPAEKLVIELPPGL